MARPRFEYGGQVTEAVDRLPPQFWGDRVFQASTLESLFREKETAYIPLPLTSEQRTLNMPKTPKYTAHVEAQGKTWRAFIQRRVSNRKFHVSKSRDDFSSEEEAQAWADTELKGFMEQQAERSRRENSTRRERADAIAAAKRPEAGDSIEAGSSEAEPSSPNQPD